VTVPPLTDYTELPLWSRGV